MSTAKSVPSLSNFLEVSSKTEFEALKVSKSGSKRKMPFFATIPPSVAEACQGTDMTPGEVFQTVVDHIKKKNSTPVQ